MIVVDDGSRDGTLIQAATAGAEVVVMGANRGLGAAVRRGLAEAVDRGAAAVAFCDADGEYAPEELGSLIAPILEGRADYVVGSRFAGRIERMRPHRRLGNIVLTRLLSFVARTRITDGQSGYRALSRAAAAEAEIAHDFNYAQVLTLDLLAKGYRYAEVPSGTASGSTGGRSCACCRTCAASSRRSGGRSTAQSSTTWPAKRPRARAQASSSKEPSRPRQSAAAQAMARAWWALSCTNSAWRPSVSRAGCSAAQPSRAARRAPVPARRTG